MLYVIGGDVYLRYRIEITSYEIIEGTTETDEIIIDENCFVNAPRDPLTIRDAVLDGDILTISVQYSGGGWAHDFALIWAGDWEKSNPMGTHVLLSHDAKGDLCEAFLPKTLSYDLTPLKEVCRQTFSNYFGPLIIKLDGWEESIIYEFGIE